MTRRDLSREELSRLVRKLGKAKRSKSRPDRGKPGAATRGRGPATGKREAARFRGSVVPVSTAQQRLWFYHRLVPGSTAYNVPLPLRLRGPLDAAALHASLREVVRRHQPLRTRFTFEQGEPVQVVEPTVDVPLPVIDLHALPPERAEEEAIELARREAGRPFDLGRAGLSRFTLVRVTPESHLLAVVFHHIVADGWSIGVFLGELGRLYPAFGRGEPSPLPEPSTTYADFVDWERERLAGPELQRDLGFWRDRLAGAPRLLRLPTDRLAPKERSDRGGSLFFAWSPELARDLGAVCTERRVSLFTGLLATFQALMARYADTDAPVVGVPVANRRLREAEGLIGMFVNTLPMRADLSDDPTFTELLERTGEALVEAREHAVPFERLVEELHPARDLSHPPIYQVSLGLQNTPRSERALGGLETEVVPIGGRTSKLDLSLQMVERNDRLEGELQYSTELFDRTTVRRLLGHLERLTAAAVARPERRIGDVELLAPSERQQLVAEWNDSARPRREQTVAERVATWASRRPDAVAVVDGHEAVTYGELERRGVTLAERLVALGVGPEERVGILAERSVALVVGAYATLRAGAAYVPLDPSNPASRLRFMIDDARVRVLLARSSPRSTGTALVHELAGPTGAGPKVVWLGDEVVESRSVPGSAPGSEPPPAPEIEPSSLAYVIFTSGSTGTPKGTLLTHRSLANLVDWHVEAYDLDPDHRTSMVAGPGFDASVWETWPTLSAGATLEIVDRETAAAPERLTIRLAARRVNVSFLPTPLAEAFLDESEAFLDESEALLDESEAFLEESEAFSDEANALPGTETEPCRPALRSLLTGGDALHRRPAPGARFDLINHYGPTESTVVTTRSRVAPGSDAAEAPPIGRPITNLRAHVLDAALRPVPIGVPGELCAAGDGLSRGYLGRPRLTAELFVPDPFGADGERLYRTGDLVRLRRDGEIEFLGRIDHQVKIRGFRIELGEIESRLRADPRVAAAAVLARPDAPGGGRLDACVVPLKGEAAADLGRELRRTLATELPEYMVPATFTVLDELPVTPNGKIDRRALAERIGGDGAPGRPPSAVRVAPRSPTEKVVAELWEELLGGEEGSDLRVGVADDFFALGGHSLLVTRLVAGLRERLGVDLPVRTVFEHSTLGALAAAIEGSARVEIPPVRPVSRQRDLPLSFSQERLWFLDRMEPGRAWYNLPAAVRLSGALDVLALARSLGEIVRRHEALRTAFLETEEASPVQVVHPAPGDTLPLVDLSGLEPDRRDAEAEVLAVAETLRPFDLTAPPLVRSLLLRKAPDEHLLAVAMHHIVSDGWSVGIFLQELAALYAAFRRGRPAPLPELPVQYPDFAVWQRSWLSGPVLARRLDHWRERLAGAPELLELPTDRPRPPVQGQWGGQEGFRIPPDRARRLQELARTEGATLFMALLAAFDALLHRLTGASDVVVGAPVAGRVRPEVESLIGFFVNTLPLRAEVAGTDTFRGLLSRVRDTSLDDFEHEDVPFEKLVEEMSPTRDPSFSPIFQVLLALQNAPMERRELPGVAWEPVPLEGRTAKFDLTLVFVERSDGALAGSLEFNRDLFDRTTTLRLLEHLQRLVAEVVERPDRPIGELGLLSPAARQQILEWNASGAAPAARRVGEEATIDGLVAARAARAPDAVAVVAGSEAITFGAFDRRSSALARRLRALGVGPEQPVGIAAERSVGLVVGLQAILRAGGAYVPLDPSYPAARLRWMFEDSGARVLLAQRGLEDLVADILAGTGDGDGVPVVWLDDAADAPSRARGAEEALPAPGGGADRLAYVIYTSGSTGRPKGVMNAHGGVVNRLLWMIEHYGVGPDERFLQKTPFGFDVSVWELFTPLICGARLEMARPGGHRDPAYLATHLAERGITTAHSVPSMLRELLEVPEIARCSATLRRLVASGEELTPDLVERFFERLGADDGPSPALDNFYGPTEAAIEVSHWRCAPPEDGGAPATVPIGRPVAGTTLQVVDPALRPVPVGVAGELLIGGVQVARGYRGLPARTAEAFVPDPGPAPRPAGGAPGARVYRTGDLARRRPDGAIEFLGRIDHQVKVRGFRIELGEIESVLGEQSGVRRAVVLALSSAEGGGDRRLVACLLRDEATAPGELDPTALRGALAERLPDYMVPAGFVVVDELPLLPSGKVDRQALAERAREEGGRLAAGAVEHVPPRTPVELVVAEIWGDLLGLGADGAEAGARGRGLGVHDDFFTLGGHSLLVTRLVARLRERLGVDLPVRTLFEAPTLGALAAVIEDSPRVEVPSVRPVSRKRDLPLSFSQERLWFLDRMEPGRAWYNLPSAVRLEGTLDVPALARGLGEIVRRHEALRTVFGETGESTPVQVVQPPPEDRLPVIDLSGLEPARREAAIRARALQEALRPFDLGTGPLLRSTLLRADADEHVLVVTMHHIASDGWSVGIFLEELAALYAAFRAGRPSPLPELPVQYPDFAVWQRTWLSGDVLERRLDHWRAQLAGAPELLELPTDRPRPPIQTQRGGQAAFELGPGEARRLRSLARDEGATLFMALLAGFDGLLHRLTGADDLVVGSPVAGRVRPEVEGLIGFFVNTLPLRARVAGSWSFRRLLAEVREVALDAFEHEDVPFERLVEELQPRRDPSHSPVFQVVLALQNAPMGRHELPGIAFEPIPLESRTAKFDLTLVFVERPDGALAGSLEYNRDLFDPTTARRMLGHYRNLLAGAVDDPEEALGRLPLLSAPERHQLLAEWNDSAAPPESGLPVHRRVARRVEEAPDAVAVTADGEALTYGGLGRRAAELTGRLRDLGAGPGRVVALCLERSADLVTAALATLETGAAYLPVDPSYPDERRAFMLEDSGASVVVTPDGPEAVGAASPGPPAPGGECGAELAYVIYTSGSTGRPKGTLLAHRGLANLVDWHRRAYDLTPDDRSSMVAGPGFDASVWETWPTLASGATLAIADRETVASPERLTAWLAAERVSVSFLPTPLAEAFLEEAETDFGGPGVLARPGTAALRKLLTGGDALHRRPRPGWSFDLINHYGPTEGTVVATRSPVAPARPGSAGSAGFDASEPPPIGRPIANLRTHVLDGALEPVPVGVPGELHVAGVGLSQGYLRRPGLTAERFVPDPFGAPGDRLYRTGDLVRLRTDGEIEFLGRIDHQVKIRGFRVELGEIEARMAADPRVAAAVVLARPDAPGGGRLDGYAVPADDGVRGEEDLGEALRDALAAELPDYMVPSVVTVLDELPLTANGKVDRRALPEPGAPGGGEGRFEPPRTATEKALARLWEELLGLDESGDQVGRDQDFFALGGHSLLATRLVSRIRRELGVELPLKRLFEDPTVAGLARSVEALGNRPETAGAPPLRPRRRPEVLPPSFAQERLWFLDRFDPGSPAYNIPNALRLEGWLDLPILAAALSEIVRRHEALRTTFESGGSAEWGVRQVVGPPFPLVPPVVDLQELDAEVRVETHVERLARREAERPFDLERGPLVRASLLRLGPREHVFLLTFHHIVADGWSAGIFVRELAALYEALREDRPAPLPELPLQYPDFALWQREWLAGDELERQLAYWRDRLAGAPEVLELPTDRPRPSVVTAQGRRQPVALSPEVTEGLRRVARERGTTLFAVVLAAFDVLLYRYSGQDDLVVGAPIANRNREEIENLIGFFVNTLALRVSLEGDPGFLELLDRVRERTAEAYAHQDLPFEKLVGELQPVRSRSHSPIFQVMLSMHDLGIERIGLSELEIEPVRVRGATAKFDLTLALAETSDGLRGILGYRAALFDAATIARMAGHLDTLLRDVLDRPERSVRGLRLTPAAEEHQILFAFNDTAAIPAGERALHRLVEARAAAAADAVALTLGEANLSYGVLDARANRLARHLRRLGAAPGELVAVCLERSFDQIVAVLASLKAGAAYLPLDLGFPGERLAFMVDDARPVALVTRDEHLDPFAGLAPEARPRTVLLDPGGGDSDQIAREDAAPLPRGRADAAPDDPAYVIYTSGSTGRPKGVLVSHRSLAERLASFRELFAFGPGDRQFQFASLSFDLSCDEVFLTLTSGATLVLEPRPATKRPLELMDDCARRRITKLSLTSSHWHQVVDELVAAERGVPASLRLLVTGAESPSAEKFAELARRAAPGTRLFNFYGPTEATISGTRLPLPADPETIARFDRVPIGHPFRGVRVHLGDPALQPVPVGVAGEILLGGSGVAMGYLGRPALTAERFVPDPWSSEPGGRLYRSGDLARHRPGGAIEFLGRADAQVKVRGFRIELGEVEETLREHPGLADAVAAVRAETGERRLVAYVVPRAGTDSEEAPTVSALRSYLGERLPEFMVPGTFVTLEALPTTPTGKVDKKALPAPDTARPELAGAYVPPESALEKFLAEAWQEVLHVDRAGLNDSFFDLGGSSIQGATLINHLEEVLGEHVYVTALFDTDNLGELSHYLAVQYPERVAELFGEECVPEEARVERRPSRRMEEEELAELRAIVQPLAPFPRDTGDPNPPAVFVLSPPRSGSTLLRVMLAGHPKLFAPPELELLSFNTLGERKREFSDRYSFWLEGVLRALMELHGCDADEARRMMEEREATDMPVKDFYRELQRWAGDHVLVDKTPSYSLDPAILERAEEDFAEPLYIHLLRHPYGGILSFEEARLEQLFFRYDHPFERRELAELIWTASHQNILSFLEGVPESRQRTVCFEELVREPEPSMRELSRFLGLEFTPAMTEPYQERQRRMTDGIHEQAKMLGDVKFHRHKRIDSSAAERWREVYTEDFLGGPTRRLARSLGYRDVAPEAPAAGAGAPAPAPRRLPPCLSALRPGDEKTGLFLVHAVFGDTYFFRHLAAHLAPGRPVYGLRALGMEAGEEPLTSIEEMAALYVDSIRRVQPEGPYHLVGSSMGGIVAFEMARQLRAAGQSVGLLGLLDTGEPGEAPAPDDRLQFEIEALEYLVGDTDPEAVKRLESLESRDERLAHILRAAKSAGALPASFDLARLRRLMDVVNANGHAMHRYEPKPYDGDLVHFRAAATAERRERSEESGWNRVCGGRVEVEIVPGDHMSIHFPPHVEPLTGSLDQRMVRAEDELRARPALSTNRTG